MGSALPCPLDAIDLGRWSAMEPPHREPSASCLHVLPCLLLLQSSEELKGLLEVAFTKQKEALVTHWGQGVDEEANIDK